MASAKFAKSTVNHSHKVICNPNQKFPRWASKSRTNTTSVMTAPTSTTNITGCWRITRRSSFQKESRIAFRRILRSPNEVPFACGFPVMWSSKCLSCVHQQMLENRSQAQGREEGQRADDQNHRNQQHGEEWSGNRKSAEGFRNVFLCRKISSDGQDRDNHKEPAKEHGDSQSGVVPKGVCVNAAEGGTVVAHSRRIGVENLREAMRPGIADAR